MPSRDPPPLSSRPPTPRPARLGPGPRLIVIGAALLLSATAAAAESTLRVEVGAGVVSVQASGVALGELLQELALESDLDLELAAPLPEPVAVSFAGLPPCAAVERILQGTGYAYGCAGAVEGRNGRRGRLWVFAGSTTEVPPDPPATGDRQASQRLAGLAAALGQADVDRRLDAVFELAEHGCPAAPSAAEQSCAAAILLADAALFDLEPSVREEAVLGLGEIGDRTCLPTIQRALLDLDPTVREAAMSAAVEIGGDEAALALAAALGDEDPSLREEAVYSLGEIGGESAIHLVEQALADDEPGVRQAAAETLAELTE